MTEEQFDVIFVGSGIGALTAAAVLSLRGKRVLVLERHKQFGGYASAFGRDGATFEVSLHQIGGIRETGLRRILEAAGVYNKLTFLKHEWLSEIRHPKTGEVFRIPNGDMPSFQNSLEARFPHERAAIRRWFSILRRYGRQVRSIDYLQAKGPIALGVGLFLAPFLAPRLVFPWAFPQHMGDHLRKVRDPWLYSILTHFSAYYGLPASQLAASGPMIANYGYYLGGGYTIEGGGAALSRALARVIKQNGGDLRRSASVDQISTQDGRVTGVRVKGENAVITGSAVVASAGPIPVLRDLLQDNEEAQAERARLEKLEVGMSALVLYLKLDCPIGELNRDLAKSYEYFEVPEMPEDEWFEHLLGRPDFATGYEGCGLMLTVHSNLDERSKGRDEDCTVLDLFFPDNYSRWQSLSNGDYQLQKETETERLLSELERLLPGVKDHVAVAELGTPRTMERFTGNHRGAIYGFAQTPSQTGASRPAESSSVQGLSFVSAWGWGGGGYEGSIRSGWNYVNPLRNLTSLIVVILCVVVVIGMSIFISL